MPGFPLSSFSPNGFGFGYIGVGDRNKLQVCCWGEVSSRVSLVWPKNRGCLGRSGGCQRSKFKQAAGNNIKSDKIRNHIK